VQTLGGRRGTEAGYASPNCSGFIPIDVILPAALGPENYSAPNRNARGRNKNVSGEKSADGA
jgi:hypothetical protein